MVFTLGGQVTASFGLNKLLREYTDNLNLLISDKCFSAGTLFALGCNKILMTKFASLSPIDPSTTNPLNPAVSFNGQTQVLPLNVEDLAGFKNFIKDEWKIKGQGELSEILLLLSEKVHPLALGKTYRARQQIDSLATKLLEQHRNDENTINKIVKKLSKELGSHDYFMYRKEAQELLGSQIEMNDEEEDMIWSLQDNFSEEMELGKEFNPQLLGNKGVNDFYIKRVLMESENEGDKLIQEGKIMPGKPVFSAVCTKSEWESYN